MESENISLKYSCGESRRRSCESISILVVDDDTTCLSFVAALLKKLKYEVVTAKHPNDALCALRIKGGAFDLVVSDVHMPDMNGFQLQEAITHEFNLPVVLMSVDSKEVVLSRGMKSGAAFFISKPVSPNDVKDLWKFVGMRKKSSRVVIEEEAIPEKTTSSTSKVGKQNKENSKRKPPSKEGCDNNNNNNNAKKPKVIWTNALHYRFLEAIRTIGLERSVPKKILEAMNVPGLTRENVASHLQKYRMFLKRVSDASYKLEFSNDEGLIGRRSVSNYASSAASPSLLTLNRLSKPHFPCADRFTSSSTSLIDQLSLPKPNITASNYERCVSDGGFDVSLSQIVSPLASTNYIRQTSQTNYMGFGHLAPQSDISFPLELQGDDMVNLDQQPQYLGVVGDYQDQLLPPPSDLENGGLVHEPEFRSMYNLPPFDLMDNIKAPDLDSPQINIQDLAQKISQQSGCDHDTSSLHDGMINSSYDQALYQQVQQGSVDNTATIFNTAFESLYHDRGDDDFLESILAFGAFGEDQIQTLEGI